MLVPDQSDGDSTGQTVVWTFIPIEFSFASFFSCHVCQPAFFFFRVLVFNAHDERANTHGSVLLHTTIIHYTIRQWPLPRHPNPSPTLPAILPSFVIHRRRRKAKPRRWEIRGDLLLHRHQADTRLTPSSPSSPSWLSGSQARSIWGKKKGNSSFGLLQGSRPAPRWGIPGRTGTFVGLSFAHDVDTYRAGLIGRPRTLKDSGSSSSAMSVENGNDGIGCVGTSFSADSRPCRRCGTPPPPALRSPVPQSPVPPVPST